MELEQIYEVNGMKVYRVMIQGYECQLSEFKTGYSVRVPYGDTPQEIEMFDDLVYSNKDVYNGKNAKVVLFKVNKWIEDRKNTWKKK